MSISFDIHHATPRIEAEYPKNGLQITVQWKKGVRSTVYFDNVDDWWQFRQAMPRTGDYVMHRERDGEFIRDHGEADKHAREFYHERRVADLKAEEAILRVERSRRDGKIGDSP